MEGYSGVQASGTRQNNTKAQTRKAEKPRGVQGFCGSMLRGLSTWPTHPVFLFLAANFLTIVILSRGRCGLSKCISAYMMTMAVADFTVIVINVILYEIMIPRLLNTFLHHTNFLIAMMYVLAITLELSQWSTVAFTVDRYVAICCQKLKPKYCRVKTLSILAPIILILLCVENIPLLFAFEPRQIIGTVSWGTRPILDVLASPAFVAFIRVKSIQSLFIVFGLMFLFNGLTIRHILLVSKARRAFRSYKSGNAHDREMESRKRSIVLLFSVSASFTLLWLPVTVTYFITSFTMYVNRDYFSPAQIAVHVGTLLVNLSSCTNTFIYAATQSKFKEELKTLKAFPCSFIMKLARKKC
ncbi:G-protein coupled receptor 15-like [Narcine bancroftii]|uniref:G-protein coupled receptor 15-like n=1 Tax=Narcine bancroftii TaxID=1343680 RepID=UPI0038313282